MFEKIQNFNMENTLINYKVEKFFVLDKFKYRENSLIY